MRVALLGFGVVGQSVARILVERAELADALVLTHVFNRDVWRKRVPWTASSTVWTDRIDDVLGSAPDVVVELIGGIEPAGEWVHRALRQGAAVVTANKALLAARGEHLFKTAAAHRSAIRFEAAVAGGIPLIEALHNGLAGDEITCVAGVLNGTCNHVLSRMTETGVSMNEALDDARRLGYAEADASADIDGHDAAAKLAILAGVALGRRLQVRDVTTRSIRRVEAIDVRHARRLGCTIRQIASVAAAPDGALLASVGPALVPATSALGQSSGPTNVITVTGRYGGTTQFLGAGAGGLATAVSVVSDLVALARRSAPQRHVQWREAPLAEAAPQRFYVRLVVADRPGIWTRLSATFERHGLRIADVLQEPGFFTQLNPLVVIVDPCREQDLRPALDGLAVSSIDAPPPLALPMLMEAGQ